MSASILPAKANNYDVAMMAAKAKTHNPQLEKAAKDFEAVFLNEMFSHMFEGSASETDPLFGGGKGEKMFKGMLINEYAKKVAHTGQGIGISDQLQKAMIDMQQKANGAHA